MDSPTVYFFQNKPCDYFFCLLVIETEKAKETSVASNPEPSVSPAATSEGDKQPESEPTWR